MLDPKEVAEALFATQPRAAKREVDEYARSHFDDEKLVLEVYVHYFLLRGDASSRKSRKEEE